MRIQLNHKTKLTIEKNNLFKHKYYLDIKGCPFYPWSFFETKTELLNHLKSIGFNQTALNTIP